MRYSIYPILGLILVVSSSLSAGTIHKWVDENGSVHYSDAPPAKTKSENIRVQSAPSNPGKALPRLTSPEAANQAAAGNEPKLPVDEASEICKLARQDLEVISTSSRIKLRQADGSVRYLSKEEIEQRRADSQAEVDQFCN
ncbi:MAG: DUF4124 domain-containing protein [Gammaproteobacteria bacterium]|jgi:hypothetical protein|nr:DUF4124 domain-containing protein [Gammaproteobacteria bacterium]